MLDCAWCGLPVEVVSRWERVVRVWDGDRVTTTREPQATARCVAGHWYGGPAATLGLEDDS